jgi:hypothetical protein
MKDEKRFKYDNNLEKLTDVFVRNYLEKKNLCGSRKHGHLFFIVKEKNILFNSLCLFCLSIVFCFNFSSNLVFQLLFTHFSLTQPLAYGQY